jgi:hypothetical protein
MKKTGGVIFAFLGLLLFAFPVQAQSILYAATGSAGTAGTLYTIDASSGSILSSHAITNAAGGGAIGITGLAFSPTTGVLYGVTVTSTNNGNTVASSLVTINPNTGVATVIGALGISISDISFRSNGTLYGFEARTPYSLATINLSSGVATTVGISGLSGVSGGGLAFSPTGTLYVSAKGSQTGTLDTLNPATGALTIGPALSGALFLGMGALAFDAGGTLFGADNNGTGGTLVDVALETINIVTGAVSFVIDLPDNTDAIAFAPVPEPSTAGLFALGAAGTIALALYRRRG